MQELKFVFSFYLCFDFVLVCVSSRSGSTRSTFLPCSLSLLRGGYACEERHKAAGAGRECEKTAVRERSRATVPFLSFFSSLASAGSIHKSAASCIKTRRGLSFLV